MENQVNNGQLENNRVTDATLTAAGGLAFVNQAGLEAFNPAAGKPLPAGFPTLSLVDNGETAPDAPIEARINRVDSETAPDAPVEARIRRLDDGETAPDAPIEARINRAGINSETAPDAPNLNGGKEGPLGQGGKRVNKEMHHAESLGSALKQKTQSELFELLQKSRWIQGLEEGVRTMRPSLPRADQSSKTAY